ncbi:sulfotransferase domain-containing protein [Actinoplanes sp. TRM 88003]|uniref:Sulfotransferase domain-containing protein n=1 Tax=Paractinoplanes aksuensis TaxID=2939490 RepID=A0ABT1E4T7_9ACTN|nr:sulfotransferase domain-containing protein [Actinoplanes aksuensis]MCO8277281.1 sulfotransferase domain-containing protein [Actinoplanes aksuensis]
MICALLIFQTPDLPAPLWHLSPWLDTPDVPPSHVDTQLARQQHRRFIKTHAPLAAIPFDARVTYVVTARHPVDAFISMYHQDRMIGPPPPGPPLVGGSPPPGPPLVGGPLPLGPPLVGGPPPFGPPSLVEPSPSGSPLLQQHTGPPPRRGPRPPAVSRHEVHRAVLDWIGAGRSSARSPNSLPATMEHLAEAWSRRAEPNVVLVHYDDLRADLEGQMRRLADELGIAVAEPSWPTLAAAATFESMRARDDVLVPPPPGIRADTGLFFRRGTSGAAREVLADDELAWYHSEIARLAPPDLVEWLHR